MQSLLLFYSLYIIFIFNSSSDDFTNAALSATRHYLYVIIYITSIKKEFIHKILHGFLYSMMFSEFISYLIHFQIIEPINNATVNNPVPFVLSHSVYAVFLGISVGIMLYLSLKENTNRLKKVLYFIFFITASANIFLIASRVGFILYSVNILIVLLYIYRNQLLKIFIIGLPLIMLGYILAYNYSATFKNRLHQTITNTTKVFENNDYSTSLGVRIGHYVYSYDIIKNNLLFGVGVGKHVSLVEQNIKNNEKNIAAANHMIKNIYYTGRLHSDSLDILVKFGLIGLFIYFNIFYQLYKYTPINSSFRVIQLLLIVSFLLSGLQGETIMAKDLGKLFVLLGVLTVINSHIIKDKKSI